MSQRRQPQVFPLKQSAARVALLEAIQAGFVNSEEIQYHLALEAEPQPRRKPCVAFGQRFESVTAAARWAVENQGRRGRVDHRVVEAQRQRIRRRCDQDSWEGFYWCE